MAELQPAAPLAAAGADGERIAAVVVGSAPPTACGSVAMPPHSAMGLVPAKPARPHSPGTAQPPRAPSDGAATAALAAAHGAMAACDPSASAAILVEARVVAQMAAPPPQVPAATAVAGGSSAALAPAVPELAAAREGSAFLPAPAPAKRFKAASGKKAAAALEPAAAGSRRGPNAYILFCNETRPELASKNPSKRMHELAAMMGAQWRELDESVKAAYRERSYRAVAADGDDSAQFGPAGLVDIERTIRAADQRRAARARAKLSAAILRGAPAEAIAAIPNVQRAAVPGPGQGSRQGARTLGASETLDRDGRATPRVSTLPRASAPTVRSVENALSAWHAAAVVEIASATAELRELLSAVRRLPTNAPQDALAAAAAPE